MSKSEFFTTRGRICWPMDSGGTILPLASSSLSFSLPKHQSSGLFDLSD